MLTQFFSWFKPFRMADPNKILNAQSLNLMLDPNLNQTVDCFLILFMTWAEMGNPKERMGRFEVLKITLCKMLENTEHEYLKIETRDKKSGRTMSLLLDRIASKQTSTTTTPDLLADPSSDPFTDPSADPPADPLPNSMMVLFFERLKKFAGSIGALLSSGTLLTPMEEDSSSDSPITPGVSQDIPNGDSLSISDKISLSITHTADLISDSLNLSEIFPAHDRFLGAFYVNSPSRQGTSIGHLIPTNLSLFDLAVLAFVTHILYPDYSYLKEQCYFFSEVIFASVRTIWKTESVWSNDRGRYGGFLVQWVDQNRHVNKVVKSYNNYHSQFANKVFLFKSESIEMSLTITLNTALERTRQEGGRRGGKCWNGRRGGMCSGWNGQRVGKCSSRQRGGITTTGKFFFSCLFYNLLIILRYKKDDAPFCIFIG